MPDRRAELAEAALCYVLEHGLIGLSLRPLAAAVGTSDRMLIYHFGSKETLIAEVVALANHQLAGSLGEADSPVETTAELVQHVWRALAVSEARGATRLYLELCVLSVGEPQHYLAAHERIREPWLEMLRSALTELGVPSLKVAALADLILDTIDGLLLDQLVTPDSTRADAAVEAFAELLERSGLNAIDSPP